MITAAEKFDKVPPWCVRGSASVMHVDAEHSAYNDGTWRERARGIPVHPVADLNRIARLTRPLPSWEPAPDCALPVEGWKVCPAGGGWIVAHQPDTKHAWFNVDPGRVFDTRRAAYVWAWTEAEAPEDAKPRLITEADVKVGQVWVCGLPTCEHRRRVDGISGGRVRTTSLSPREGCDSVDMTEFVAYLNRTPPSTLITDGTGATDGPSDDLGRRTMKEMDDAINDRIVEFHELGERVAKVEGDLSKAVWCIRHERDRITKVEGVLHRICPEADSQVDGKGRTLVQINAEIDRLIAWRREVRAELDGLDRWCDKNSERMDNLIAAQVPVPAKVNVRSDAASTNEAMTEAAASDEGWREMLVTRGFLWGGCWLYTPDGTLWWSDQQRKWFDFETGDKRNPCGDTDRTSNHRRTCKPPPNLAEWYKPGHVPEAGKMVDDTADRAERLDTLASLRGDVRAAEAAYDEARKQLDAVREAVPRTYRIPGEQIECGVRNLASAHDLGVKAQAELRTQLAAAQTAATAAEGRAATATKRASSLEDALAKTRTDLERVQSELAETNDLLNKAIDSAETPS